MSTLRGRKPAPGFFHVQYGLIRRNLFSEQPYLKHEIERQFASV